MSKDDLLVDTPITVGVSTGKPEDNSRELESTSSGSGDGSDVIRHPSDNYSKEYLYLR